MEASELPLASVPETTTELARGVIVKGGDATIGMLATSAAAGIVTWMVSGSMMS